MEHDQMSLSTHPLNKLTIPTGPEIEFRALPYPLQDAHRNALMRLGGVEINTYVATLRKVCGVDYRRRSYLLADGLRAAQRNAAGI